MSVFVIRHNRCQCRQDAILRTRKFRDSPKSAIANCARSMLPVVACAVSASELLRIDDEQSLGPTGSSLNIDSKSVSVTFLKQ